MIANITDLSGKTERHSIDGVFFFNAETFGDPLSHYERVESSNYEPGQKIVFVNVNAVTSVVVHDDPDD